MQTTNIHKDKTREEVPQKGSESENIDNENNLEISINYANTGLGWQRNDLVIDDVFAYSVAREIMDEDDNDPKTMEECRHRNDWTSWKGAIDAELESLNKRGVFGTVAPTPKGVKPVGYKWVFVRK